MLFLDINWDPFIEKACSDRMYCIGQKKSVTIYKFVSEKTIEERILQLQQQIKNNNNENNNESLNKKQYELLFQEFND